MSKELTRGEAKVVRMAQNGHTVNDIIVAMLGAAPMITDPVTGRGRQHLTAQRKNAYQKVRNLLKSQGILIPSERERVDYEAMFDNLLED